jgi:hypothetical protein
MVTEANECSYTIRSHDHGGWGDYGIKLDYFSQFVALWIYITYLVTGLHDRASSIAFAVAATVAMATVLALYAI